MSGERFYHLCYKAMFYFAMMVLFVIIEIVFCLAGWMLIGSLGRVVAWGVYSFSGRDLEASLLPSFFMAGKACGLIGGVLLMRYVWMTLTNFKR